MSSRKQSVNCTELIYSVHSMDHFASANCCQVEKGACGSRKNKPTIIAEMAQSHKSRTWLWVPAFGREIIVQSASCLA